jgi:peptidoglycan hydrolase-like protein with peptidoglycan-binding domain
MFEKRPTYSPYRTLKLVSPRMQGEDVYALQTAMEDIGTFDHESDGVLGPITAQSISLTQRKLGLYVDGACGGMTQTALVKRICEAHRTKFKLPKGLPYGQCMHESSCRVGNYSPVHASDGGYDAGVAQRNTAYTKPEFGFNVPESIDALASNLRKYFDKFRGLEHEERRWELAAGAWNAPAFACYIARQEGADGVSRSETAKPSDNARLVFEQYMKSATAYLELN